MKNIYFQLLKIKNKILCGGPVLVLMYHRISEKSPLYLKHLTVTPEVLEEQIKYFVKKFKILSVHDSWNIPFYKKGIVLTFDDGYFNNYKNAYPILKKYKIPAIIFVSTKNIDHNHFFWWDEFSLTIEKLKNEYKIPNDNNIFQKNVNTYFDLKRILESKKVEDKIIWINDFKMINNINLKLEDDYRSLTSEEILILSKDTNITIGGHTVNHDKLDSLNFENQLIEIKGGNKILKEIIKKEIKYFAFPHGSYNKETKKIIENLNIEGAFLANDYYSNQKNKSSKMINRIIMNNITGKILKKRLSKFI